MSASLAGRNCTIHVSVDGGSTYHEIEGIASFTGGPSATPIDDSEFGISWMKKLTGILDNKISLTGGFKYLDTNGQRAILDQMIAGSSLFFKVLFDGSTVGWTQEMICTNFGQPTDVKGRAGVDIQLEGNGAMTFIDP